ncbi:MAG: phospholipase [Gemmatimonadales bacterium]|nr:phospholipase [Gemmatimonadales bacterium]
MVTEWTLPVSRTARYATLGTIDSSVRDCWVVCHGYGQLAAEFLTEFEPLRVPGRVIVAPEGLSRFYLEGESGAVGASWMTRESRETEIADYVGYLEAVHHQIRTRTQNETLRVTAMGFSQGTATVCRWVGRGSVRPARVVLWGGPLLPDEELAEVGERLAETRFTLVVGTRDRYVDAAALRREIGRFEAHRIPLDVITFDGGHRLDGGILRRLAVW